MAGDTYEVQLWVAENRTFNFTQSEYFIGGSTYGVDASPTLLYPTDGIGTGEFITGTFVATSFTETIGFVPSASPSGSTATPQLNLFQVRDISASVPEPSTIGLTAVGLLLARGLRRRRA